VDQKAALTEQLSELQRATDHESKALKGLEALVGTSLPLDSLYTSGCLFVHISLDSMYFVAGFYKGDAAAQAKAETELSDAKQKLKELEEGFIGIYVLIVIQLLTFLFVCLF
jgi:hypothetical protein